MARYSDDWDILDAGGQTESEGKIAPRISNGQPRGQLSAPAERKSRSSLNTWMQVFPGGALNCQPGQFYMQRKPISPRLRFIILKRDGFACHYCGKKSPEVELHVDHIVPVAAGGSNDHENLITACSTCNQGKGAQVLDRGAVEADAMAGIDDAARRRAELAAVRESLKADSMLDNEELQEAMRAWQVLDGSQLSKRHVRALRECIRKHGLAKVVAGMKTGLRYWSQRDVADLPKVVLANMDRAIEYSAPVARVYEDADDFGPQDLHNVRYGYAVLRNRGLTEGLSYAAYAEQVKAWMAQGLPTEQVRQCSKRCRDWAELSEMLAKAAEFGQDVLTEMRARKCSPFSEQPGNTAGRN